MFSALPQILEVKVALLQHRVLPVVVADIQSRLGAEQMAAAVVETTTPSCCVQRHLVAAM
jgi:hypothetical protein